MPLTESGQAKASRFYGRKLLWSCFSDKKIYALAYSQIPAVSKVRSSRGGQGVHTRWKKKNRYVPEAKDRSSLSLVVSEVNIVRNLNIDIEPLHDFKVRAFLSHTFGKR